MIKTVLRWRRFRDEPFIAPRKGTCAPDAVTTPDLLIHDNTFNIYVGAVQDAQERIILLPIKPEQLEKPEPLSIPQDAKVVLAPGPLSFDSQHVFDPAIIVHDGKKYLYYSAIGTGPDYIGLATSFFGDLFTKLPSPILEGRSPEVIIKDNEFYLYYVRERAKQGYAIYLARSKNGIDYQSVGNEPVLIPGEIGEWDDFEVTTPRIFRVGDSFYIIYSGINRDDKKDIPRAFGLARSQDLIHWEKYPQNPVFSCAEHGFWDDGAIWFGTTFLLHDTLYLMYEGGRLENIIDHSPALTQVGLATLSLTEFQAGILSW